MANESQSRMARRKQKQQKKKPVVKNIFLFFFIMTTIVFLSIGSLFTYYVTASPKLDAQQLSDPASSRIYDKDGNLFAELGTEKRTKIEYDDLPEVLVDAVIATEDSRFFSHLGIDPKRIGGAILANITDGFGSEGASTITQQVIKGSFLSPEKTLKRKVQEQWLAIRLDSKYSKEEILEMYLNKIYYGNNSYGVAKAAENYFGKSNLNELTLPEAALLAGLPQRPSAYDPTVNPDLAQERMNTVLKLMVDHGKITEEEAAEAKEVSVESLLVDSAPEAEELKYEAFLQQVRQEAKEKFGVDIYNDGVEVHTTIDPVAQEQVEFLLSDSADNPIVYPDENLQAGLTVLDTNNGSIRAIGGGRKTDEGKDGWNYAIDGGTRQPGSTFKPITAYGPAIEYNQWPTYQQIEDSPYEKNGIKIRNWNRQHQGWITMRKALRDSLNVPAIRTLEATGFENAQKFAEGLGIEFANDQIELTDAIGGAQTGVTPLQLAGAYSAFGNEGIYHEPYSITSVVYSDGRTEEFKPEPVAAMREYTAYMITDMLKTVVTEGTGTAANVPGLSVAGKTGTTNLADQEGSPDAWFSGYTTNYTIAVWTGYGTNDPIPANGLKIAQMLFQQTMTKISQGKDTPDFAQPESVVEVSVERGTNPAKLPSSYTPSSNIVTELFVKGTEPSSKSERFDQIDAVSGLRASFDENTGSVNVAWNYGSDAAIFKVRGGSGSLNNITTTSSKSIKIPGVERGTTYTVEVTAISETNGSNQSNPVTATVTIPGTQEEIKAEPEEEPAEQTDESEEQPDDAEQESQEDPAQDDSEDDTETNSEEENSTPEDTESSEETSEETESETQAPAENNSESDESEEEPSSTELEESTN